MIFSEILPPPVRFDANEWYILLNASFGNIWMFFLPKKYPHAISLLLMLFCVTAAVVLDHSIATSPLDWYDINDRKAYELMDVFTYFMYAPYALLCVYLYDKWKPKGIYFVGYVVAWAFLALFFEWLALLCHVFTYTKWRLAYSFSVYLALTPVCIGLFEWLKRHIPKKTALGGIDGFRELP